MLRPRNYIIKSCLLAVLFCFGGSLAFASGAALATDDNRPAANQPANSSANSRSNNNPLLQQSEKPAEVAPAEAPNGWLYEFLQIFGRLLLAVILSGVLAFRPRQNVPLFRKSLFVSQTQILLAVVAAGLMMIVGDNTARAFAIFAAVSLVRFRTNIRDPKEITVLLISLALGLAAGVGRWELGVALCLFALALLWILEYNESSQVFRSMELTVKTRDPDHTKELLRNLFAKYKLDAEIREIQPVDEETPIGAIVYYTNLRLSIGTDHLSDKILSLDPFNVEGIQWSQKKGASDIYQ